MREHALPQDVTGYRFHIIGNMTLKQFAEVAAGCVVGFIIYSTNLPYLIKWPLIFFAGGFGALLAFVPFEERPLDQWFVAFIQALYRPTQFFWKRDSKIPEPFLYEPHKITTSVFAEVDLSPARRQRVKEYLHSINAEETNESDADMQAETQVLSLFESTKAVNTHLPLPDRVKASKSPTPSATPSLEPEALLPSAEIQFQQRTVMPDTIQTAFTATVLQDTPTHQKAEPKTDSVPNVVGSSSPIVVPELQNISVTPTYTNGVALSADTIPENTPLTDSYLAATPQGTTDTLITTQAVVQNSSLPFPDAPTEPNKVVGMAIDPNNTPLQNVIIEVLTENNMPARAVKTNMLGQFFITTPLANGRYVVQAEKEGYQFPAQELILDGNIVTPIEVRST
jgi:hypothetical protein